MIQILPALLLLLLLLPWVAQPFGLLVHNDHDGGAAVPPRRTAQQQRRREWSSAQRQQQRQQRYHRYCRPFASSSSALLSTRLHLQKNKKDDNDDDFDRILPETSFGSEIVPEGQRPINEYLNVLRQPFFDWATLEDVDLAKRLAALYASVLLVVCVPIARATFTADGYLLQTCAAANVGAVSLVLVFVLRLWSAWQYVGSRLTSSVIEYEETGWYDGDVETKTETERKRDKLLYGSTVRPVVERSRTFSAVLGGILLVSVAAMNWSLSINPMFDEYSPETLSRLQYDDKLAQKAAMNSRAAGKPTYCDSRYYRAVAGGGQGCN